MSFSGRRKNCLRTSLLREKLPLTDSLKPGQIYDAHEQCRLMHGPSYIQVQPRQDHYDGICHMMWCGQGSYGRIVTSHPALEGTFCGPSKWFAFAWIDFSTIPPKVFPRPLRAMDWLRRTTCPTPARPTTIGHCHNHNGGGTRHTGSKCPQGSPSSPFPANGRNACQILARAGRMAQKDGGRGEASSDAENAQDAEDVSGWLLLCLARH